MRQQIFNYFHKLNWIHLAYKLQMHWQSAFRVRSKHFHDIKSCHRQTHFHHIIIEWRNFWIHWWTLVIIIYINWTFWMRRRIFFAPRHSTKHMTLEWLLHNIITALAKGSVNWFTIHEAIASNHLNAFHVKIHDAGYQNANINFDWSSRCSFNGYLCHKIISVNKFLTTVMLVQKYRIYKVVSKSKTNHQHFHSCALFTSD